MKRAVALLSGGLDSATLAYFLAKEFQEVHLLSFDYGQRHKKELVAAQRIAHTLHARYSQIMLSVLDPKDNNWRRPLSVVLGRSSLTDPNVAVPDGHYAEESMKATVVPNRNAIMLSIAYGVAVAEGAEAVAFAAHAGDHAIYPDCRPEFVQALNKALVIGNAWADPTPMLLAPFIYQSKAEIATMAHRLRVPIANTWSCYKGGDIHCGVCGTCYERREALAKAEQETGLPDPTEYLDTVTQFEAPHV